MHEIQQRRIAIIRFQWFNQFKKKLVLLPWTSETRLWLGKGRWLTLEWDCSISTQEADSKGKISAELSWFSVLVTDSDTGTVENVIWLVAPCWN